MAARSAQDLGLYCVGKIRHRCHQGAGHGFTELDESGVDPGVAVELLRSADEGIAEFLDLERVKPNTLGNTRMLKLL